MMRMSEIISPSLEKRLERAVVGCLLTPKNQDAQEIKIKSVTMRDKIYYSMGDPNSESC